MAQQLETLIKQREWYEKYKDNSSVMVPILGTYIIANNIWFKTKSALKYPSMPYVIGGAIGLSIGYYFDIYLPEKIKKLKLQPYKNS
jgi:hypothetical protein